MHYEILQQHGLFNFERITTEEIQDVGDRISRIHDLNSTMSEKLADLVVIAAAEFSISGFERIPQIVIEQADVFRAVGKIDTLLLLPCRSVWRWFRNEIDLPDVFLFVADLQKAESILENMRINIENLNVFRDRFSSFANEFVTDQTNPLSNYFLPPPVQFELVLKVQTVIWNLRLGLLLGLDEGQNRESTNNLMEDLGIQNLMR